MGNAVRGSRRGTNTVKQKSLNTNVLTKNKASEFYVSCEDYYEDLAPVETESLDVYEELTFLTESDRPINKLQEPKPAKTLPPVVPPKPKKANFSIESSSNAAQCLHEAEIQKEPADFQTQTNDASINFITTQNITDLERRPQLPPKPRPKPSLPPLSNSCTQSAAQLRSDRNASYAVAPASHISKSVESLVEDDDYQSPYYGIEETGECFRNIPLPCSKSMTNLNVPFDKEAQEGMKLMIELLKSQTELQVAQSVVLQNKEKLQKAKTEHLRVELQGKQDAVLLIEKSMGDHGTKQLSGRYVRHKTKKKKVPTATLR